ncbi:hypothetical protein GCM10020367_40070 [Streptomyces sannanensis]|uniref:Uncharacterized protein n=1 Tax=Streptomyces sannanensis TaxID=285536 RepID=A0ABP6SFR4_9ACTN
MDTEPQRHRWASLLMDAADETGLPGDPEFRSAFARYIERGTRIPPANSQPEARLLRRAPVPRWGRRRTVKDQIPSPDDHLSSVEATLRPSRDSLQLGPHGHSC